MTPLSASTVKGSAEAEGHWQVWVDTGGTFTDCLALSPTLQLHRAKVLSSSALRARLKAYIDPNCFEVEARWPQVPDFCRGYQLRVDGVTTTSTVVAYDPENQRLHLAQPVTGAPTGATIELTTGEEAPVLAARVVTSTPADLPLPPMNLRLATTRGTNALLERNGAATVLFITRGFADLLRIGDQQRPDLFALQVVKSLPLYTAVVEVDERLDADGNVLRPLNSSSLTEQVQDLHAAGIRSAAIALLHSYRNPDHEQGLAAFLHEAGMETISISCQLAPLIKILPRAQTAVVDAYLTPIVGGYLDRVEAVVGGQDLHVMTSAGGLTRREDFRTKDSLLSGPAGGVAGAVEAARRAGIDRVLSFDMGGTSTDVARYDGDFDYEFEHRVGDAHLVAPALAIETVAAGGGSICTYASGRLRVGPESAGASPGPACYGAGGPLTITDVNLLMGRLDATQFEIPVNQDAAQKVLDTLCEQMKADGSDAGVDEVLAGLVAIADDRMAAAIRRVSLERGVDPTQFALVTFGGAGGQHACGVASRLGIGRVLVPTDAGLLSARGLGAAVVERFAQRQILQPLDQIEAELDSLFQTLGDEARLAVQREGQHPD
ncbi:MAG: hydantoinase/oxoprolinase family protein, partial [Gemmatimonadetes bacterium]|nr:hydantoinase/oxoprolinase family protein [Gemmatimonadota bacterium]